MPYIDQKSREELKTRAPKTVGELNFLLTKRMHHFAYSAGVSYGVINEVTRMLLDSNIFNITIYNFKYYILGLILKFDKFLFISIL